MYLEEAQSRMNWYVMFYYYTFNTFTFSHSNEGENCRRPMHKFENRESECFGLSWTIIKSHDQNIVTSFYF